MRKLLVLVSLTVFAQSLWAQSAGQKGVGVMFGNPTGLAGKLWRTEDQAIDGGLGWSIGKHTNFSMHSDYLWHSKDALFINDVPVDVYYGAGARMEFADNIELGLRLPIGIAYNYQEAKADMFAEIAPILDFISTRGVEIHLTAGARYYFD